MHSSMLCARVHFVCGAASKDGTSKGVQVTRGFSDQGTDNYKDWEI